MVGHPLLLGWLGAGPGSSAGLSIALGFRAIRLLSLGWPGGEVVWLDGKRMGSAEWLGGALPSSVVRESRAGTRGASEGAWRDGACLDRSSDRVTSTTAIKDNQFSSYSEAMPNRGSHESRANCIEILGEHPAIGFPDYLNAFEPFFTLL